MLLSSDKRARVFDADGTITSEGTIAVDPSDLSPSTGVQVVADAERLYLATKGNGTGSRRTNWRRSPTSRWSSTTALRNES